MFGPHHQHFLGSRLARTFDELDRPTKCLFHPTFALLLTSIASVHPQVRQAGELLADMLQERLDSLLVHKLGAVDLCFEYEALGVHQQESRKFDSRKLAKLRLSLRDQKRRSARSEVLNVLRRC